MRILLLGEYSNVHWTLAEGLRILGHEVCVVSNGDFWKNYPRDISLVRHPGRKGDGVSYVLKLLSLLPRFRNYDVVQLINPCFLELKAERILPIYRYLKKHNKKVFLGGYGMDYYWVQACTKEHIFRYSDFNIGETPRCNEANTAEIREWLQGKKGKLNRFIAPHCNGIITGLYEYYAAYSQHFPDKTAFIPFPINLSLIRKKETPVGSKIRFFIGIQKARNETKGTDIMYRALQRIQQRYPRQCEIVKAESVPYEEYQNLMNTSDVLLDQLYSYTPGMNGLLAMAKGIVLVGGGEKENYELLGEPDLRPIVNVLPDEEDVFNQLEKLVLHPEQISLLSAQSIRYIEKYHSHIQVAQEYLKEWRLK